MDAQTILVGNLQEALRQLQKYLAAGFATSLSLLLLAWAPATPSDGAPVEISGFPIAVAGPLLEGLLIAIFMATGWLCYVSALDARKIASRINTEFRAAAALFPTVVSSQDKGMRIIGAIMPAVIYAIYLVSDALDAEIPTFDKYWFLSLFGIMPYVGLMLESRRPLDRLPDQSDQPA